MTLAAGVVGVTIFAAAGCDKSFSGHMFARAGAAFGSKVVRPGVELGFYYLFLQNTSKSTLRIQSIGLSGPGIGSVAKVTEVRIAPLRIGYHMDAKDGVSGGIYVVDPPAYGVHSPCHFAPLRPVQGFKMTPGSMARVWILVRALRPGRWAIPANVVRYTAEGIAYRQAMQFREHGSVATDAPNLPVNVNEARCVRGMDARLLAGHHLPSSN